VEKTAQGQATQRSLQPADCERLRLAIARLQALPAFYPTVQRALRLLDDPTTGNSQIQQVITTDQALAARILQLANSAYFGFYSRVSTISLALTLIGRERVATLLRRFLSEEMIQMLSGRKPAAARIRELSLVTATAAHAMAERLLREDQEEILLAGLLHNIGELVLLSQFRDDYEEMLRLQQHMLAVEAERAVFGATIPLVGKWLLDAWEFPRFFLAVTEHWPDPWVSSFPGAPLAALALVHTARRLAESWLGGRDSQELQGWLSPRLLSTLEVDREFVLDLYRQLPREVERVRGTLA
jgi:HD-like signal output (HDOD) protein